MHRLALCYLHLRWIYYIFYFNKLIEIQADWYSFPRGVIQAATLSLRQELFPLQAVPLDWFQLDYKHTLSLQEVQGQHELTR